MNLRTILLDLILLNTIELYTTQRRYFFNVFTFLSSFSIAELYEYALQPEHLTSVGDSTVQPTTITKTGALSVHSGRRSGRVPKEKRIVYDETTKDTIWWGDVNIPLEPKGYARN